MDIHTSLSQFQSTIRRAAGDGFSRTDLLRPAGANLSDTSYRNAAISNNIFQKSLQLYNDLSRLNTLTSSSSLNAPDYRALIEEKGLDAALQSYIQQNQSSLAASLRGSTFDATN